MPSPLFQRRHAGFLLLEVMLGIGLLGTFLSGIGLSLLLGQENTIMAGDRIHAVQLSQRALEAARSLRDEDFQTLRDAVGTGARGVAIDGGVWALQNDPVTDAQGFETALTLTEMVPGPLKLRVETKWKRGYNRSGSVLLETELTDWRAPPALGDWSTVIVQGSGSVLSTDPPPHFTAAALAGDYLFATGEDTDGGAGLYVLDLSSLSNPQLETSINLGASGLDLAIRGDRLYVLTDDNDAELRVFDIADPAVPAPLDSRNLSREGRARSLAFWGDRLLVGMTALGDPGVDEVFRLNLSTNPPVVLDSLNIEDDDILAMAVSGTSALLATSDLGAEFQVADIRSSSLSLTGEGYNADGDLPGRSIATANSRAVLGRSGLHGLTRFDLTSQGFVTPALPPPTQDVGGFVNGVAMDAAACIAFAAVGNNSGGTEIQVVRLGGASMTSLGWLNRDAGDGRAVVYDTDRDRAYLLTDSAWYVLRPGPGTLTCP